MAVKSINALLYYSAYATQNTVKVTVTIILPNRKDKHQTVTYIIYVQKLGANRPNKYATVFSLGKNPETVVYVVAMLYYDWYLHQCRESIKR